MQILLTGILHKCAIIQGGPCIMFLIVVGFLAYLFLCNKMKLLLFKLENKTKAVCSSLGGILVA